ncbi:MAG: CHAT domain-containing protein [Phycisphaerales bacterium]|nr:MAG: CHAT domain-containing protein [Phycisphaerales bacterium]
MLKCHQVSLEFVRPGPPHNQLLSPLTPYMALCGGGSPITFYLDFEHHQFLHRLKRLRYLVTTGGRSGVAIHDELREAAVAEVGRDVARIFAKVGSLLAEEWRVMGDTETGAHGENTRLVDLRLVVSGSELALIPFEMAIAPQAYPGEGLEWALQPQLPIVPIREIRTNRPAPVPWDRPLEPKILFISAAPAGLDVPLSAHVHALRAALDPWIRRPMHPRKESDAPSEGDTEKQSPLTCMKKRLRLVPNASIDNIYAICAQEQFTHVHILAHGAPLEIGGERRYGLALCDPNDAQRMNVISGKRLAKALLAEGKDGARRSQPLLVTLATCDSGNPGSVLIPGSSIAHDLHAAGIPWVLASQFPMTKVGSVRMTEALYRRILRGDDPRQALFEVRRLLFMNAERDHDWASLVAYATIPPDFEDQVATFFEKQMRGAINNALEQADNAIDDAEREEALQRAIEWLKLWRSRVPEARGYSARARQAECYGMNGSTLKRIGLLHYKKKQASRGKDCLQESLKWYTKAVELLSMEVSGGYHWVATQALSLKAVLNKPQDPDIWRLAHVIAEQELAKSIGSDQAWAHGTLAELIMLKKYHIPDEPIENAEKKVEEHCEAIVRLMGEDAFEVYSTQRQFQRYIDYWPNPHWNAIAKAAVAALSPSGGKD